jgi:hypothetical protein
MSTISRPAALIALGRLDEAKRIVLEAVEQAKGNRRDTAALLMVRPATLYRSIVELELWPEIDALIARNGWIKRAGRDRGPVTAATITIAAVALFLTACGADPSAPADLPSMADVAGSPAAPMVVDETPVTAEPPIKPIKQPSAAGTSSPAMAGSPAPAAAGAPAPAPSAAGSSAPAPVSTAGTSAEAAGAGGSAAGAPAPVPTAGTSAEAAGAGGSAGAPASTEPTQCKIASGLVLACDAFSQRYYPSLQVMWSAGNATYTCASTDAPRCVTGAKCTVTHLDDAGRTESGVCQ